ncbi:MAG TPA: response regulator transcription factor [Gaiellaceae bacterium]|jgi:DNA-binding NarL/FixJ family response regulator|nr:response regulator transcription factor [Gaiellaceae bacterium]
MSGDHPSATAHRLEPIRVVIVDAEVESRDRTAGALARERDIEISAASGDGRSVLELVHRVEPRVVVMDVELPCDAGIHATRALAARERSPAVLAVAHDVSDELALDAIRAGAAGVCEKRATLALAEAVRAVACGYAVVARKTLRLLADRVPRPDGALERCTPREREVIELVARGATNAEVCERLVITDATVRTHIRNLRRKLGARSRAELVSRVYAPTS